MRDIPKPQQIYRHFKGGLYQIISLAEHTESGEELVIYQALYGDFKIYARPLSLFMEKLDRAKYPDAPAEYRFEQVKQGEQKAEDTALLQSRREDTAPQPGQKEDARLQPEKPDVPAQQCQEETGIDPLVIQFLDADSYTEKLDILAALHGRITDSMINTMAISIDVEVEEGEIEDRYEELRRCLLLYDRFECTRLR